MNDMSWVTRPAHELANFTVCRPVSPGSARGGLGWPPGAAGPSTIAGLTQRLERQRLDPLATVLMGVLPRTSPGGCAVLWPLWAAEAIHRANSLLRLAAARERQRRAGSRSCLGKTLDIAVARHLVAAYQALAVQPERETTPCAGLLRAVVSDLATLFGPRAGDVELDIDIAPLALPAFQRRALVLAVSELVINALCHAYGNSSHGALAVSLDVLNGQASLVVADDGVGCSLGPDAAARGSAGWMAALLGGDLAYHPGRRRGTWAEITFPVPP